MDRCQISSFPVCTSAARFPAAKRFSLLLGRSIRDSSRLSTIGIRRAAIAADGNERHEL